MGSTRLPGKHMKQILGKPMLAYLIERLRRVKRADEIVLATTTSPSDDIFLDFCIQNKLPFFRGSEEDVLQRFFEAAEIYQGDVIVRITADCPLIDPEVIDAVIDFFLTHSYDYVSNVASRTYPRGMDVEVFSKESFAKVAQEGQKPDEREHVTPYYYRHPELFKLGAMKGREDHSALRLTVDTPEDFALIKTVIEALYPTHPQFTLGDIVQAFQQHPEWKGINAHVQQRKLEEAP